MDVSCRCARDRSSRTGGPPTVKIEYKAHLPGYPVVNIKAMVKALTQQRVLLIGKITDRTRIQQYLDKRITSETS